MASDRKRDSFAGGAALLSAMAYLCLKGLKKVEERLKRREKR